MNKIKYNNSINIFNNLMAKDKKKSRKVVEEEI